MKRLLLLLVAIVLVTGVKRRDFRKCDQTSFCKRNRQLARSHMLVDPPPTGLRYDIDYGMDPQSAHVSGNTVTFAVRSVFEDEAKFTAKFEVFEGGIFRM
jgi:alpha 1,3-glucosidase